MTGGTVYEKDGSYTAVRKDGRTEQVDSLTEGVQWLLRHDPFLRLPQRPWWSRLLRRKRGNR